MSPGTHLIKSFEWTGRSWSLFHPAGQRRDEESGAVRGAEKMTGCWRVWLVGEPASSHRKLVTVSSWKWLLWGEGEGSSKKTLAERSSDRQRTPKEKPLEKEHLIGIPQGGAVAESLAPSASIPDAENRFDVQAQIARSKPWDTPHVIGEKGSAGNGTSSAKIVTGSHSKTRGARRRSQSRGRGVRLPGQRDTPGDMGGGTKEVGAGSVVCLKARVQASR